MLLVFFFFSSFSRSLINWRIAIHCSIIRGIAGPILSGYWANVSPCAAGMCATLTTRCPCQTGVPGSPPSLQHYVWVEHVDPSIAGLCLCRLSLGLCQRHCTVYTIWSTQLPRSTKPTNCGYSSVISCCNFLKIVLFTDLGHLEQAWSVCSWGFHPLACMQAFQRRERGRFASPLASRRWSACMQAIHPLPFHHTSLMPLWLLAASPKKSDV